MKTIIARRILAPIEFFDGRKWTQALSCARKYDNVDRAVQCAVQRKCDCQVWPHYGMAFDVPLATIADGKVFVMRH